MTIFEPRNASIRDGVFVSTPLLILDRMISIVSGKGKSAKGQLVFFRKVLPDGRGKTLFTY